MLSSWILCIIKCVAKGPSLCMNVTYDIVTYRYYDSQIAMQDGDKVIYSKYAGTEVSLEGNDHVLLKVNYRISNHQIKL